MIKDYSVSLILKKKKPVVASAGNFAIIKVRRILGCAMVTVVLAISKAISLGSVSIKTGITELRRKTKEKQARRQIDLYLKNTHT